MDSSLDNIWDEPIVEDSPKRPDPPLNLEEEEDPIRKPTKRPRQTLFLADSDDDVQPSPQKAVQKAPPAQDVDIDALFADIDEEEEDSMSFKPLPPRINEAEYTRQAEERARKAAPSFTPHQIMPSSSPPRDTGDPSGNDRPSGKKDENEKDEKKARRKHVKLDENRLLAADGIPQLIKMTKDFKIKGKGHEATDLNRLLQKYQYWTHSMYPKTQFRETVDRIEKLCHSRRMNVSLSVWRDEAHGRPHQKESSDEDDMVQSEDQGSRHSDLPHSSPSRGASPRSASASETNLPTQNPPQPNVPQNFDQEEDEQEEFWRSLDDITGDISDPPPAPTTASNSSMDEDEDMWDIVNEIEQATAKTASTSSNIVSVEPPGNQIPPDEDDWEDMYL